MTAHPERRLLDEFESLPEHARPALLGHLRACADCRARWIEREPSRLFGLLALVAPPAPALEELSRRVERATRLRPGRIAVPASLAASLLLAGLLGAYVWLRPPVSAPALAQRAPVAGAAAVGREAIEVLSPASAEVVNFMVGDTRVVMIFDGELDL